MSGRLIAVVGPSGVGKDSVMDGLVQADPRLSKVKRVITRPASSNGEDFRAVSEGEFKTMAAQDSFLLHWKAHGLRYGICQSICEDLGKGSDLLVNLSRSVLSETASKVKHLLVVSLTAEPSILARRLAARGRETEEDIRRRLSRVTEPLPEAINTLEIDNSGALETTVSKIRACLYPEPVNS